MPTTVTLKPDGASGEDVLISEANPDSNYIGGNELAVGGPAPNQYQTLIRFDLSSIPFQADILSAKLELYCFDIDGNPVVKVNKAIVPFIASEVTWNTAPYPGGYSRDFVQVVNQYNELDVTDWVQEWVNRSIPNWGMHIIGSQCDDLIIQWWSSRYDEATRPKLVITYSGGVSDGVPAHAPTHKGNGSDPVDVATTSIDGLMSSEDKTELDKLSVVVGAGVWQHVETYIFPGTGTSYSFTVNGDTDEEYMIIAHVKGVTGNAYAILNFNGDTGNNYNCISEMFVNPATDGIYLGFSQNGTFSYTQLIIFGSRNGISAKRAANGMNCSFYASSALWRIGGMWSNTANNLTSISIRSSTPNYFAAGTRFTLYRKKKIT